MEMRTEAQNRWQHVHHSACEQTGIFSGLFSLDGSLRANQHTFETALNPYQLKRTLYSYFW